MIPVTADVSNAIARYQRVFGYRITMSDISSGFQNPAEFVKAIDDAIKVKDPRFGGEYIPKNKKTGKQAG